MIVPRLSLTLSIVSCVILISERRARLFFDPELSAAMEKMRSIDAELAGTLKISKDNSDNFGQTSLNLVHQNNGHSIFNS